MTENATPCPRRRSTVRLLIADDHIVVREGLRQLFDTIPDVDVVGVAVDGEEAVAAAGSLAPDVVLMDLGMPRLDGIEATRRIAAAQPDVRVLVFTGDRDGTRIEAARQAGAVGCVLKYSPPADVVDAVRTAYADGVRASSAVCGGSGY
jgi:DNA-binding NarL/FixJ family response regulator